VTEGGKVLDRGAHISITDKGGEERRRKKRSPQKAILVLVGIEKEATLLEPAFALTEKRRTRHAGPRLRSGKRRVVYSSIFRGGGIRKERETECRAYTERDKRRLPIGGVVKKMDKLS